MKTTEDAVVYRNWNYLLVIKKNVETSRSLKLSCTSLCTNS